MRMKINQFSEFCSKDRLNLKEIYVIVGYERNFIGYKIQNECGRIGNVRGRPV